jgi:malonyl CoA-acyl carrier protein transacylase
LDEVLELLEKTSKRTQKIYDERKKSVSMKSKMFENVLSSKDSTEEQKTRAVLGKALMMDRLERISSQLSLLYMLQIFAFKVKVLEISLNNINDQLVKSGALEKVDELEAIKKNIASLKILVEAQYKSLTEIRDNQNKDLTYIH